MAWLRFRTIEPINSTPEITFKEYTSKGSQSKAAAIQRCNVVSRLCVTDDKRRLRHWSAAGVNGVTRFCSRGCGCCVVKSHVHRPLSRRFHRIRISTAPATDACVAYASLFRIRRNVKIASKGTWSWNNDELSSRSCVSISAAFPANTTLLER